MGRAFNLLAFLFLPFEGHLEVEHKCMEAIKALSQPLLRDALNLENLENDRALTKTGVKAVSGLILTVAHGFSWVEVRSCLLTSGPIGFLCKRTPDRFQGSLFEGLPAKLVLYSGILSSTLPSCPVDSPFCMAGCSLHCN